ncbi:MAG: DNA helicase UvrD [Candidatus Aminicenantes bacterium 4484_214]|nr:MAG: DNA helicase UvrD [Candidatus Aminicenantes bacterium 4484_214]RLI67941.1 MAG: DNA helicase UvrD [Candidatus Gerdarchaeota archaeon]
MKFVADLHLHSKFSRATSKDMTFDTLAYWAKIKGIKVLGTGDFTHPEWLFLAKQKLVPNGQGLFYLEKIIPPDDPFLKSFKISPDDVLFMLTTEISFIYSKKGRVRKIHLLILAPDFETAEALNNSLSGIGNLHSDGRPILGLDAKEFLKKVIRYAPQAVVIPAHIWTPWFSLFGANSGFNSIEECFEELTPHIFALETGLSSDPPMNWRLSALDKYTLVSNSDAHSPSRIGREANVFNTTLSYKGIIKALKQPLPDRFLYTIEFFPEEGKYHYDGHRHCQVIFSPEETKQHRYLCPRCGKKLTIGVLHRVEELADRKPDENPPPKVPFLHLIPLNEIIGQALGKSAESRSVWEVYFRLIHELGNEHRILTEVPLDQVSHFAPPLVSRGIERMRQGKVTIVPGHDGVYGKINLFAEENNQPEEPSQLKLF